MSQTIAFIGGGNMATALIGGLLHEGWVPAQILVVEPNEEQRERLSARFGVTVLARSDAALGAATAVLWAVKPQVMREAVAAAAPFTQNALHVSIAAGTTLRTLTEWLGTERVVRAMPNLPAIVRAGVTGLCAGKTVDARDRELAAEVLSGVGHVFWADSEDDMDAVTAVSGSGPGYVFHFLEGFQKAAEAVGFPPAQARELVLRVTAGAVELARQDPAELREMRARVSSKGGTTLAGTKQLDEAATQGAMFAAVKAARDRARQLGAAAS